MTDSDETAGDEAAVRDANSAFYAALESRDLDAMSEVWEHSDRIVVTHPGWPMLRGWARVAGSWEAIFHNTGYIQFVLTDELITVVGDSAWVTLDENILQATGGADDAGELSGARVAAVNVFVHTNPGWQMVLHQGSPVSPGAPDE